MDVILPTRGAVLAPRQQGGSGNEYTRNIAVSSASSSGWMSQRLAGWLSVLNMTHQTCQTRVLQLSTYLDSLFRCSPNLI